MLVDDLMQAPFVKVGNGSARSESRLRFYPQRKSSRLSVFLQGEPKLLTSCGTQKSKLDVVLIGMKH